MKFYNIDINLDPKITGRRNGSFAVEIKKNSFEKDEHKEYKKGSYRNIPTI